MKKIVFNVGSLKAGGAERVISEISNYLTSNYEVYLICWNDRVFYEIDERVKYIPLGKSGGKSILAFRLIKKWLKLIKYFINLKKISPDVVISFIHLNNVISIFFSKILRIPIIISERGNPEYLKVSKKKWLIFMQKIFYPKCNYLVVQTKMVKKHFENMVKNIVVIPNPVRKFSVSPEIKKEKIILSVGRLTSVKGYDFAIKAFSKATVDNQDWKYIIAGVGPEKRKIEKIIKENNIEERVELIGNVKDIGSVYQKTSIFIFTSIREGFPNALLEAMSMGLPCVSFNCDYGPGELIENGVNGFLVKTGDYLEMSNKIKYLIKNEMKRNNIGKEAEKVREKYAIENIANEWIKVIESI